MTTNVLILCTHNSARSVLSEGMLNHWAKKLGRDVHAFSAGSAPSGRINPYALEALGNAGVDVPLLIGRDGHDMQVRVTSADRNSFLKAPRMH